MRKGSKGRKVGRDIDDCKRYRLSGRREKNKIRKLRRHIESSPNDKIAAKALSVLE